MAELKNARQLDRKLKDFGWKIYSRWSRKAMMAGSRPIIAASRGRAPKRTGALRKALGRRIKSYPRSMNVISVIGVRNDFVASRQGDRMVYLRGGKAREAFKAKMPGRIRPSKYAHLVEGGSNIRLVKNWFGRKKWFGMRGVRKWVGRMPATPFLEPGFNVGVRTAAARIIKKLREGITAEARR